MDRDKVGKDFIRGLLGYGSFFLQQEEKKRTKYPFFKKQVVPAKRIYLSFNEWYDQLAEICIFDFG